MHAHVYIYIYIYSEICIYRERVKRYVIKRGTRATKNKKMCVSE